VLLLVQFSILDVQQHFFKLHNTESFIAQCFAKWNGTYDFSSYGV